jgi:hypothetical protein
MRDKRTNVVVGELPGLGDSFFKDMAKTTEASSAAVGEIDGRWAEYSRQYERASHLLIESMETGEMAIYPAVFLYRHFLELQLKAILALGVVVEHVEDEKVNAKEHATEILNTHNLTFLTGGCRTVCERVGLLRNSAFATAFTVFEGCIQELSAIDPESFAFRYPTDKRLQPTIRGPLSIDLPHLTRTMHRIATLLRLTWIAVNNRSLELASDEYEFDWTDEDEERHRKDMQGIDELEAEQETDES